MQRRTEKLQVRVSKIVKALVELERKENGGTEPDAVERLVMRGSDGTLALELVKREAMRDPQLMPAMKFFKMKTLIGLSAMLALTVGAEDFRAVAGRPYSMTSPEWIAIMNPVRVDRYLPGGCLLCTEYTARTITSQTNVRIGPGVLPTLSHSTETTRIQTFVLTNYPGARAAIGGNLQTPFKVMRTGGEGTWALFDYGTPWYPPARALTSNEVVAAKSAALKKKEASDAASLKWFTALAGKGDARGQYELGLRYLNGQGTATNAALANDCFAKSAAQGNEDAKAQLVKLQSPRP